MANSINTNVGATVALQSLNKTNRDLDKVQKQVSTGYKVADAKDDGAAFAVAQGLRGKVKGNEAVNERLGVAKGLLSVTQTALQGISDTTASMRATLVKLADANLSSAERTSYNNDYTALQGDITKYIGQASFGGSNLINSGTAISVISDATGGTISLTAANMTTALSTLTGNATATAANAQAVIASGAALDTFEAAVNAQLASVGANSRTVDNQDSFVSQLGDTINDSIGSIVDADLAKASAKLQALQIRQQLGTQSLSIANQAPSALLSLFK